MLNLRGILSNKKVANLLHAFRPQHDLEFDFSDSDLLDEAFYDVPSKKELPMRGVAKVIYRTLDTMDQYTFTNGTYKTYNPYAFGITQQYNEVQPEVVVQGSTVVVDENHDRLVLQDVRHLPSISLDQVRNGSDPRMAILYNLEALREDIRVCGELGISFSDMVTTQKDRPYRSNNTKQMIADNWFYQNHTALSTLLRAACRRGKPIDRAIIDCINTKGAHLWWDNVAGNAKFKDGEFEVNL